MTSTYEKPHRHLHASQATRDPQDRIATNCRADLDRRDDEARVWKNKTPPGKMEPDFPDTYYHARGADDEEEEGDAPEEDAGEDGHDLEDLGGGDRGACDVVFREVNEGGVGHADKREGGEGRRADGYEHAWSGIGRG